MTAIQGTLHDMGMIHLLRVLRAGQKSGLLVLDTDGIEGVLVLRDGEVRHAAILLTLADEMLIEGEDAFYHLLRWRDGHFGFTCDEAALALYRPTIATDSDQLLIEALRQIDEEEPDRPQIGLDSWVSLDASDPNAGAIVM